MTKTRACKANFGVPEYMKNANPRVLKVDIPGFHRFQERLFHNYCIMIISFDKGIVKYVPWEIVFDMISQFSPIRKIENEVSGEEILKEVFDSSNRLGYDIESADYSKIGGLLDLSFYLLDLYQRYNEPDNIYVSEWNNPPDHERN